RLDGVDRDLRVPVGAVLEADRHREAAGQLAVGLALGGARAARPPADEVGEVLRRDHVEELAAGRHPQLGQVEQQAARDRQPLVDLERAVEVGVVDEPLPPDGGARLLEVDPHDDEQRVAELRRHRLQPAGVLACRGHVVDRAGADDRHQPIVLAAQDPRRRLAALRHRGRRLLGDGQVLHQDLGRDQRPDPGDAKVVGGVQHGAGESSAFLPVLRARRPAAGAIVPAMRRGLDGFREDADAWRAAVGARVPVYDRLLEAAGAMFADPAGPLEEAARARVEAAWRERRYRAGYDRPLLLMAALRAEALRAGARHPLHAALALPEVSLEAATRPALASALADAPPRL